MDDEPVSLTRKTPGAWYFNTFIPMMIVHRALVKCSRMRFLLCAPASVQVRHTCWTMNRRLNGVVPANPPLVDFNPLHDRRRLLRVALYSYRIAFRAMWGGFGPSTPTAL